MINKRSLALICEFEGLRLKAYQDSVGVWTIGYGTTVYPSGTKVKAGDSIPTKEAAASYLLHDIQTIRLPALAKMVKVPVTDNQVGALISLAYNIGNKGLAGSSVIRLLNSGASKVLVADAFLRWNKGKVKGKLVEIRGLTRRRKAERDLFLSSDEAVHLA